MPTNPAASPLIRITLVALLLLVAGTAWRWWQSDARRILAQMEQLEELLEKSAGESQAASLKRATDIASLFADPFELDTAPAGPATSNRGELTRGVVAYRGRSERIEVTRNNETLNLDSTQNRATLHTTLRFNTHFRDLAGRESYRLQINWRDTPDGWKIDYLRLLEVLEAPPGIF